MRKAKIYNPCTNHYIYFDYDKFLEIDKQYEDGVSEEELNAIKQFKEKINKFYMEEVKDDSTLQ